MNKETRKLALEALTDVKQRGLPDRYNSDVEMAEKVDAAIKALSASPVADGESDLLKKAAELRTLNADAASAPWLYRPCEHDDWGTVRVHRDQNDEKENLPGHYALSTRAGRHVSREEEDRHRENGTDPFAPNAKLVVFLRNNAELLIELLEEKAKK